jgi:transaldolase
MIEEGKRLAAIAPNVVVKLPADGRRAYRLPPFAEEGVQTNVTLCFLGQSGAARGKAGASYISPFVGRVEDAGGDGIGLLARTSARSMTNFGYETEILAASLRGPAHVEAAAARGLRRRHHARRKSSTQMVSHPLTDKGLAAFLKDWGEADRLGIGPELEAPGWP